MSLKAILATLIVGSSSVAFAQPVARDHRTEHRVEQRPVVRDHRDFTHRDFGGRPGNARERERVERPIARDHERFERERFERERFDRPIVRERVVRPYIYEQPRVYLEPPIYTAPLSAFVNGAMSISLGGATGSGIELSANGGEAFVQEVVITYSDGRTQVAQIGQQLDAANPTIDLGSDGSPVAAVTVYGAGSAVSAYAI